MYHGIYLVNILKLLIKYCCDNLGVAVLKKLHISFKSIGLFQIECNQNYKSISNINFLRKCTNGPTFKIISYFN